MNLNNRSSNNHVTIGYITKTHGLRGEVTVAPNLPDPSYFKRLGSVTIENDNGHEKIEVEGARTKGNLFILKFRSHDTIESVERFKGKPITVERKRISAPPDGEYFVFDIIGMRVLSEDDGSLLGTIDSILATGANDVYIVKNNDREILIPAIKEVVTGIDVDKKEMTVRLMEGMET